MSLNKIKMCFSQIRGKEADIRFFANITLNSIHSLLIMFEILKKMHFKKVIFIILIFLNSSI